MILDMLDKLNTQKKFVLILVSKVEALNVRAVSSQSSILIFGSKA